MATQSRSASTRQSIISAAVELFTDRGYSETGLSAITARAEVTTGAFYYHFDSKEDLARTIIEGWPKALGVIDGCLESPSPGLENIIVMTYALSSLMKRDKFVWIANHLNQAFGQLSETGREDFGSHTVCAVMTADFLAFTRACGNDLSRRSPGFPGLKPGDQWCICASRWQEALEAGLAPPVVLAATHQRALEVVALEDLRRHAADAS